jgi:hypothetical protein
MKNFFSVLFLAVFSLSVFAQTSLMDFGPSLVSGTSIIQAPMAPVVFLNQAPNTVNGLFADASCALCPTTQQTVADNFSATIGNSTTGITELVIWGGYYPEDIPNTTDNFTILIHSDAAGSPGAVIWSQSGLQAASRVQTGVVIFNTHEYKFTFDFSAAPIMLPPGTATFWLELFNNSTQSGNFYWETGNVDGTHGIAGSGWYTTTPGTSWNLDPATDLSAQINGNDNIVPVELVSFTAEAIGTIVNLNWVTATEANNAGFEIQRSSDGTSFVTIAFVKGHGTTTETQHYTYSEKSVNIGSFTYRLKQIDLNGSFSFSNEVEVDVLAPAQFSLDQNYPNPFNPSTQIAFSLAVDSKVSMKIFNILGQEVANLVNGNIAAGSHTATFNASQLNSGVYMYRLEATGVDGRNFVDIKKMILTK